MYLWVRDGGGCPDGHELDQEGEQTEEEVREGQGGIMLKRPGKSRHEGNQGAA